MSNIIEKLEKEQIRLDIPEFNSGDTVKVHVKIREGEKERIQIFQGVVIKKTKGFSSARFTVRKITGGVGVEIILAIFPSLIALLLQAGVFQVVLVLKEYSRFTLL